MSYLDPETDTYVGFDAELAEDLADALGVEIEYVKTSWPTLMDDTLGGKFDLAICGITITDARKELALMPKGSDDLLDYVNEFIEKEKANGRIDELSEKYIYQFMEEEEMDDAA